MNPLHITRAEAVTKILAALDADELTGRVYYDHDTGQRCSIACLFTVEEAKHLQSRGNYAMADDLIEQGELVVDDPDWFVQVQNLTDSTIPYEPERFREMLQRDRPFTSYLETYP